MIINPNTPETTPELTQEQRIAFAGEVLLFKTSEGMMTASQAVVHEARKFSPVKKAAEFWDQHQTVLDSLPDVLPEIGVPANAPLPPQFPNPFGQ